MAASASISDILGWVALTKAVNAVKDGVPNPFPPWLFTVRPEDRIIGDSVRYNRIYGMRKTARVTKYGAAPRHRELQQEEVVDCKMMHFCEERIFDPLILAMLREYERWDNAMKAKRLVANNVKTMGTLFGNSRIITTAMSLAFGNIYVDVNGNLLPSSSGASAGGDGTFGQGIPSGNIGTVLDAAGNGIFGATGGGSWAVNGTDIPLQLRRLHEYAAETHGYIPRVALYGKNVPSYLTQNDYVLDYLARNPKMQTEWLEDNTIPNGLFGMTWVPVWTASFQTDSQAAGTGTSIWPANGVTFIPGEKDLEAWWSLFEGSYEVPTTLNIVADAMAAMNSLKTVFGGFGYGLVTHKPVAVSAIMGDTFFPAVKNGNVVYIANVVS